MGLGGELFLCGGGLWYGRCVWSLWERKLLQDQYILYADFQRSVTCVGGNESSGGYLSYYGFDMNLAPGPCRMWWMHYLIFLSLLTLKGNAHQFVFVCVFMHACVYASIRVCVCVCVCVYECVFLLVCRHEGMFQSVSLCVRACISSLCVYLLPSCV